MLRYVAFFEVRPEELDDFIETWAARALKSIQLIVQRIETMGSRSMMRICLRKQPTPSSVGVRFGVNAFMNLE